MVEWEASKEEEEKEDQMLCLREEDQEEVVEEADEGELVFRRTLSGLKSDKEEQRENIFHSRCTVKGRCVH